MIQTSDLRDPTFWTFMIAAAGIGAIAGRLLRERTR